MRVEVVGTLPKREDAGASAFSDFAVERALKSFRAAIESGASLFAAKGGELRLGTEEGESVLVGNMVVSFRDEKLASSRRTHFALLEKLSGLLQQAGSGDSLKAFLALQSGTGETLRFAVEVSLEARGSSPEQAGLRWALGIAHLQQALLFVSRVLRQELASAQ
jgi:hypothetical protein